MAKALQEENPITFALGKRNSENLRSLEHNWNSNKMSCLRGVVGMEVACGEGQVPKPAVGMTKGLCHHTSLLVPGSFHNTGLLVGNWRQKWEQS